MGSEMCIRDRPGNSYLKLGSQKRSPGQNLGEYRLVQRSGAASRGSALLAFRLRMCRLFGIEVRTIVVGKDIHVVSAKHNTQCGFVLHSGDFFKMWIRVSAR